MQYFPCWKQPKKRNQFIIRRVVYKIKVHKVRKPQQKSEES